MRVLNLLASGGTGGIETLIKDIVLKSNFDNRVCFLFEEGETYRQLKKNNNAKILSFKSYKKNFLKITKEISNYCNKEKIDIIVVHNSGILCDLIFLLLKKKNPNIKFVRYLHSCFEYKFFEKNDIKRKVAKIIRQKAFNISDLLIFISNASMLSFNREFAIDNKKKIVVYNGINERFFISNVKKKKENQEIKIIYVGRLAKVKGINLLINAFRKLSVKNTKLTIVGDGDQRNELEKIVSDYNLREKVVFLGKKEDVIPLLDDSDIFVYPSIWEEGFGISVVEAMARKCIPITFKRGGLPEIIEDEKNGFIIDEINEESLKIKIEQCINLKNKYIIAENAYNTALKFRIENTVEQLYNEYNKII